jgi:tRNA A37 methylthiotransferase MiaB
MLFRMRRNHTRESYDELVDHIRKTIPGVALSSDFMCGFCDETDQEFEDTMTLIESVQYDMAFLFAYSMREKTHAHRRMQDNVPEDIKQQRLVRMIDTFKRN